MMNDVKLLGRLAADPELRYTTNGTPVAKFDIAVNIPSKDRDSKADFFTVVAWRERAEFVVKHLSKGRQIVVSGRLTTRKWKDKYDQTRKEIEITANQIYFADSAHANTSAPSDYSGGDFVPVDNDEDLPFN